MIISYKPINTVYGARAETGFTDIRGLLFHTRDDTLRVGARFDPNGDSQEGDITIYGTRLGYGVARSAVRFSTSARTLGETLARVERLEFGAKCCR
jgi:hypothetical protein